MSDYPNERDCEHGHLRRSCEICELQRELAEANATIQRRTVAEADHGASSCTVGAVVSRCRCGDQGAGRSLGMLHLRSWCRRGRRAGAGAGPRSNPQGQQRTSHDFAGMQAMNCTHRKSPDQGYHQSHAEAERRMKAGQKQRWCKTCGRYVWNAYYRKVSAGSTPAATAQ
jgi:hypothetical protein